MMAVREKRLNADEHRWVDRYQNLSSVRCPTCNASPGKPCFVRLDRWGATGAAAVLRPSGPHQKRITDYWEQRRWVLQCLEHNASDVSLSDRVEGNE